MTSKKNPLVPPPCPFCGCTNPKIESVNLPSLLRDRSWVECRNCGARGPWTDDGAAEATELWGKRA